MFLLHSVLWSVYLNCSIINKKNLGVKCWGKNLIDQEGSEGTTSWSFLFRKQKKEKEKKLKNNEGFLSPLAIPPCSLYHTLSPPKSLRLILVSYSFKVNFINYLWAPQCDQLPHNSSVGESGSGGRRKTSPSVKESQRSSVPMSLLLIHKIILVRLGEGEAETSSLNSRILFWFCL